MIEHAFSRKNVNPLTRKWIVVIGGDPYPAGLEEWSQ